MENMLLALFISTASKFFAAPICLLGIILRMKGRGEGGGGGSCSTRGEVPWIDWSIPYLGGNKAHWLH